MAEKKKAAAEQAKEKAAKKEAAKATVSQAKRGSTISLFGLGGGGDDVKPTPAPAPKAPVKRQQKQIATRQTQQKKQQAQEVVSKASQGATISLFGFGGDKSDSTVSTTKSSSTATAAPRGVPVISRWKQARDGSITGVISGSSAFSDGDPVTTSPINGKAVGGTVVTTKSGSKYFLEGGKIMLYSIQCNCEKMSRDTNEQFNFTFI